MFQVQILDSEGRLVQQIPLGGTPVTLGRDPACTVCLADSSVSRRHAVIEPRGKFHMIKDLGSTNGTWVNREGVKERMLRAGDVVHIGSFRIHVKHDSRGDDDAFVAMGKARLDDSAFEFDRSPDSRRTVRLEMSGELARLLGGRQILDRLIRLQEISHEIGLIDTPEALHDKVLKIGLAEFSADRACLLVPDAGVPTPVAALSKVDSGATDTFDIHHSVVDTAIREGTAILADGAGEEAAAPGTAPAAGRVRSVMCAPLQVSRSLEGVLYIDRVRNTNPFEEEDLRVFAVLAGQVAISLSNARLFRDILSEKSRVQAILEHLGDGLVITNESLRIERFNEVARSMLAGRNSYLVDKNLLDVLEKKAKELDRDRFMEAVEHGGSLRLVLESAGRTRVYTVSVSSCPGGDRGQIGHIFSFKDISEWANLGLLKSQFIRIASHKLRTPLTVLIGNLDLLKSSAANRDELGERLEGLLETFDQSLGHLQTLIDRFVEFVEVDEMPAPHDEVAIDEVLTLAWAGLEQRAREKNVRLEKVKPVRRSLVIPGVSDRLVQCFTNILENAIRFSPAGGTIRLEVEENDEGFEIRIEDEGPGVPDSHLPYIFSGFHQVEESLTGEAEGAGLGLTISRRILHAHGATIAASRAREHPAERRGCRISVTFPTRRAGLQTTRTIGDEVLTLI